MSAETNILRHELAEARRKLAEATAQMTALANDTNRIANDNNRMRRVLARIQHESGDQFACEMANAALK